MISVNNPETLPEKEAVKTKDKKKGTATHRTLTIVGILICVLLIPILVVNITLIVKSYTAPDEVPSLFGVVPMLVGDGEMEPDIVKGDLVIAKVVDPADVKDGDVILFFDTNKKNQGKVLTQRVVKTVVDDKGEITWETERIGKRAEGEKDNNAVFTVPAKNLVARWDGTRIPVVGSIAIFMQTIPGMIVCVALPVLLLVAYDFIREKKADKKKKNETDALLAELEALRALQNANAAPPAEPAPSTETPVEETPLADPPAESPVEPSTEDTPSDDRT